MPNKDLVSGVSDTTRTPAELHAPDDCSTNPAYNADYWLLQRLVTPSATAAADNLAHTPHLTRADEQLLITLLTESASPPVVPSRPFWHRLPASSTRRQIGLALLIVSGLVVLCMLGNIAFSALTIYRNLRAMRLPAIPSLPTAAILSPTTALATASPFAIARSPAYTTTADTVAAATATLTATAHTSVTATVQPTDTAGATASPPATFTLVRADHRPTLSGSTPMVAEPTLTPLPLIVPATPIVLPSLTLPTEARGQAVPHAALPATPAHGLHGTAAPLHAAEHTDPARRAATPRPTTTIRPGDELPAVDTAITVLLMGSDQRPGETSPSRMDAIMVVRIEPQRQRIALLSLPRDLVVEIPGYGWARINTATVYGAYAADQDNIPLMRATVSNLLGIPIDYVVRMDFMGFIGAIDAIGGITIEVEQELYDAAYPTMDYGYTTVHFLPGRQHMDGETALQYSRVRHMDSDFDRMQRQQAVVLGVLERLRTQNALTQLQRIASVTTALRDYVQTDLPEERMINLAWAFRHMTLDSIERYTLDANMVSMYVIPDDPYAQFALPGTIEMLVQQLLGR